MPWELTEYRQGKAIKIKLCAFKTVRKIGVPYILTSFVFREAKLALCLSGGDGDIVSAIFPVKYDKTTRLLLKELIRTGDICCLNPLIDRLIELEHWITPLLTKWNHLANLSSADGYIELTRNEIKALRPKPEPKPITLESLLE